MDVVLENHTDEEEKSEPSEESGHSTVMRKEKAQDLTESSLRANDTERREPERRHGRTSPGGGADQQRV
jgi:hypothetical protein